MKDAVEKAMRDAQAEGKVPEGDFTLTEEGGACWARCRIAYTDRQLTVEERDSVYDAMKATVDDMHDWSSTATYHIEVA